MPNCLNKDALCVAFCWQTQFTAFVASVAKILTYAFREIILDQNSFRESPPTCDSQTLTNFTQTNAIISQQWL